MRNPYHTDNSTPVLKMSVLVFMDILGYSGLIKNHSSNEELSRLYQSMSKGRYWLEEKDIEENLGHITKKDRYALKAFTDNIVIGWPIRSDAESEFAAAFFKIAYFQMQMVQDGYFLRGAISVGNAFVDEIAVFGPALIEAYNGEEKLARDPRIILTQSSLNVVKQHLECYAQKEHSLQNHFLLCDSDGQWFLNYLEILIPEEDSVLYDDLLKHKRMIEISLSKHSENPKIWSKFAWVARYHNYFCRLNSKYFDEEHMVEINKFEASPKSIVEAP